MGEYLGQVRQQVATAQAEEEAARRQLTAARRRRNFWERLLATLEADRPAAALLALRREAATSAVGEAPMSAVGQESDTDAGLLETVQAGIERQARVRAATFQRDFPAAMRAAGLTVDIVSRHPSYTVLDGFLRVTVDDDALTARVAPRDGEEVVLGMDVAPLAEAVRREAARLLQRTFDPDVFLRRLRASYEAERQEEARAAGEALPLRRIVARLSKEVRPFAADEFNIDLARLIRSGQTLVDGYRLRVQQTRYAKQGMLLYGLEQGGYTGFISFEREGGEC
jgi:hypothetical protein